jgi:hypothetical protein
VVDGSGLENALFSACYASIALAGLKFHTFQGLHALHEAESAIVCDEDASEMATV